ncbi:MAG: glycosyltransferase [Chloroflexi bacterium]|nr:glycosyltransferase [Chloroflexota bacterium]
MPTKVIRVDLSQPVAEPVDLSGYDGAFVIAFLDGRPLGSFTLPAPGREISAADLQRELVARLGPEIRARRVSDYVYDKLPAHHSALPTATVAICTRDRHDDLVNALASLAAEPALEVLVVDNNSRTDDTRRVALAAGVRYVREPVPGLNLARNRALTEARGDVVVYLDDDATVEAGRLDAMLRHFADPEVAVVLGPVMPFELETRAQELFEQYRSTSDVARIERGCYDFRSRDPLRAGGLGVGANFAVRRGLVDAIGPFHPNLGGGTETRAGDEIHLFYKVFRAGYRVVVEPNALVYHRHRTEESALKRQVFNYNAGTFALFTLLLCEHGELRALREFVGWLRRYYLPVLARTVAGTWDLPGLYGYREILGALYGPIAYVRGRRVPERRSLSRDRLPDPVTPEANRHQLAVTPVPSGAEARSVSELASRAIAVRPRAAAAGAESVPTVTLVALARSGSEASAAAAALARTAAEAPTVVQAIVALAHPSYANVSQLPVFPGLTVETVSSDDLLTAANRAVARAEGDVVVCFDAALTPDAGFVAAHLGALAGDRGRISQGRVEPAPVIHFNYLDVALRRDRAERLERLAQPDLLPSGADLDLSNAAIWRASLLDEVGPFDLGTAGSAGPSVGRDAPAQLGRSLGIRLAARGLRFVAAPTARARARRPVSLQAALEAAAERGQTDVALTRAYPDAAPDLDLIRVARSTAPSVRRARRLATTRRQSTAIRALGRLGLTAIHRGFRESGRQLLESALVGAYWKAALTAAGDLATIHALTDQHVPATKTIEIPLESPLVGLPEGRLAATLRLRLTYGGQLITQLMIGTEFRAVPATTLADAIVAELAKLARRSIQPPALRQLLADLSGAPLVAESR